jgi:DNA-binding transcriptional regulator YhcF (GntR family)
MKKNVIFQEIRQEIISGRWHEGDKLPTEFEYAEIYRTSRGTIRRALKQLEDGGFIQRVKSQGTFVHLPEVQENSRVIYLLVPCCDYLRHSQARFHQLLFELIAEAAKAGWSVIPVVFSKTNSNQDIWWENLARFNRDSRIVVNHSWYANYFESLAAIGSRVAFINTDAPMPEAWSGYTSGWVKFIEMRSLAAEKAVKYLAERRCRKIGLAMRGLYHPMNSFLQGYIRAMEESGLEKCLLDVIPENDVAMVSEFYRKNRFDGLIVHLDENCLPLRKSFRAGLALPADMPVVSLPIHDSSFYLDPKEKIVTLEYSILPMVADIVKYLTAPQYRAKELHYELFLVQCGKKTAKNHRQE